MSLASRAAALVAAMGLALPAAAAVTVKDAWVRGTVPGQSTTGGYLTLRSSEDARLVAVATPAAKRALVAGETLDGEGGYTVWGKLMTARESAARRALPIGLAHKVRLKRDIPAGSPVSWDDVEHDARSQAVTIRREMERAFGEA